MFKISRTVAAGLVHDDEDVFACLADFGGKVGKHYFVEAGLFRAEVFDFDPVAVVFAAGVVFAPENLVAGFLQYVEQVFGIFFGADFKVFATAAREHTGNGDGGRGAAGGRIAVIDDFPAVLVQRCVGRAGVAAERKVGGAGGFADHEDKQVLLAVVPVTVQFGVVGYRNERMVRLASHFPN